MSQEKFTDDQLATVREIDSTTEVCPTCHRTCKIYHYPVSGTMCRNLREMAKQTNVQIEAGEHRGINVDTLPAFTHSDRAQVSKMRQHGLVAKYRDQQAVHVKSHWLVTHKGFDFLKGKPIPEKVDVYDNAVIGHSGGTITIKEAEGLNTAADEMEVEQIAPSQARMIKSAEKPGFKGCTHRAIFKGRDHTSTGFKTGEVYEIVIEKLVIGSPIKMVKPEPRQYRDVAAFAANWQVLDD